MVCKMEDMHFFWNVILTLVVAPIIFSIRKNETEAKRIDILINKTREEIAKEYVTKQEVKEDMGILMERLEKLHEKVDKLFEVK